jgi:DNA-binding transcriptional LysR family regulator
MTLDHSPALNDLPLRALAVFEAAARHLNMVRAAAELGMTQGAVSRQIRSLEDRLREQLFRRGPRGLTLTEAGDLLCDYVVRGFGELSTGLHRIGQPKRRTTLTVSCSRTFALRVLAPRVGGFVQQHPWIDFRVVTHRYYSELERSNADLSIRLGNGSWSDRVVIPLTQEIMFPVCAPTLIADPAEPAAEVLRRVTLLHYAERPYWTAWLKAAALDPAFAESGPRFDETALTLAAAEAGQGIAIARHSNVAMALTEGRLIRPFAESIGGDGSYFIVTTEKSQSLTTTQAFITWCKAELRPQGAALDRLGDC